MQNQDVDSPTIYIIPENFIDEGRIVKGMFKTRNFIEGIAMALVAAIFANLIPTSSFETKISVMVGICGPFLFLGINGINGDSVFQTIRNAFNWAKSRTVFLYNNNSRALSKSPLESMMEQESAQDKIIDMVEKVKDKRREKMSAISYVEGVNFEFAEDTDLIGLYADEDDDSEVNKEKTKAKVSLKKQPKVEQAEANITDSSIEPDIEPDEAPVISVPEELFIFDDEVASESDVLDEELTTHEASDDDLTDIFLPLKTEVDIEEDLF